MEDSASINNPNAKSYQKFWWILVLSVLGALLTVTIGFYLTSRPPADFPINQPVTIEEGQSALEISKKLEDKKVIKSSSILYGVLVLNNDAGNIRAGEYIFSKPHTVFEVAYKLISDQARDATISLTFPEGFTVTEYAKIANEKLSQFEEVEFIERSKTDEGYLFPDTYYVPKDYSEEDLIELLKQTYNQKTKDLFSTASTSLSEYEIITLASIIEREGKDEESMRMISGILQKRLNMDMPLQADASMEYVLDKPLDELTAEDLEIDSPYNTYKNIGLPPTPIGNPGLRAIRAVLNPKDSKYLYYLTGNDGNFYYAETYKEHQANIESYLK